MSERIPFRGGLACSCVVESLPWVEEAMRRKGIIKDSIDIFQLGYRGNVAASAGTHDAGGCTDVGQRSSAAIQVWREWGWTMQDRSPWFPKAPHAHGWPYGCPHLAGAARDQNRDWNNRRNGLVSNGPVRGLWPVHKWDEAIERMVPTLYTEADIATRVLKIDGIIVNAGLDSDASNKFVSLHTAVESLGRSAAAQKKTNAELAAAQKATNAKLDATSKKLDALIAAVKELTPPPAP